MNHINIIDEMYERTMRYASSVDLQLINGIQKQYYYYFNSPHVIKIIFNNQIYNFNSLHTILYDLNVHFIAIAHNLSSKNEKSNKNIIDIKLLNDRYILHNMEFTKENFTTHKSEILEYLLKSNSLLSIFKNNDIYTYCFAVNVNNIPKILIVKPDDFTVMTLPTIDGTFGTQAYYENNKPYCFKYQVNKRETEYIFYYAIPHYYGQCHSKIKELNKWHEESKRNHQTIHPHEYVFHGKDFMHMLLIYRVDSEGRITKMYSQLTDCPDTKRDTTE